MATLLEILQKTTAYLAGKGVANAKLNAELLLAHVLKLRRLDLYLQFDRPLAAEQLDALRPLVQRRGKREPLEYITGSRPFVDIELLCDSRALIPRSETEELVELLATRFRNGSPPRQVLDLGTGTGALALALAKLWPQAAVTAVDASAEALSLARTNAEHNHLGGRVTFLRADWFSEDTSGATAPTATAVAGNAVYTATSPGANATRTATAAAINATDTPSPADTLAGRQFDLIVSNPPYLTQAEWQSADPEVKDYEPYGALVAAEDGLADLRSILCTAPAHLAPGGLLALETGIAHHEALAKIAVETGAWAHTESHTDSDGRPRFFLGVARG